MAAVIHVITQPIQDEIHSHKGVCCLQMIVLVDDTRDGVHAKLKWYIECDFSNERKWAGVTVTLDRGSDIVVVLKCKILSTWSAIPFN